MSLSWEYIAYGLFLALLSGAAVLVVRLLWEQRGEPGAVPLIWFIGSTLIRVLANSAVVLSDDPTVMDWGVSWSGVSAAIVPATWFLVAWEYTRGTKGISRRALTLLLIEPIAVFVLMATNPWHHLMLRVVGTYQNGPLVLPDVEVGQLSWIHLAFSSFFLLATSFLLIRFVFRSASLHRRQVAALLIGMSAPLVNTILLMADVIPFDLAPVSNTISAAALSVCILRFKFLDVTLIARTSVIEEMQQGFIVVGTNNRVADLNSATAGLLQVTSTGLVGKSATVLNLGLDDQTALREDVSTQVVGRESPKDGSARHLEIRSSPIRNRKEVLVGRLHLLQDVTSRVRRNHELKSYTEALEAAQVQLQELDEAKSRFFANISHEFRTPLTLTIGPLEDIRENRYGPITEEQDQQLAVSLLNARRILRLINQLLDIARLESGHMALGASEQDLSGFVRGVASNFVPLADRKKTELRIERGAAPVPVYMDVAHMEKIVGNLLSNALKFSSEGGLVRIETRVQDGQAVIEVADTGKGIAEEDLPHVFERFYRVSATGEHHQSGTGIGLALVHDLVVLHSGTIQVESSLGVGTTFTVTIPMGKDHLEPGQLTAATPSLFGSVAEGLLERYTDMPIPVDFALPDSPGSAGSAIPASSESSQDKTTILVVDDNAEIRAFVRRHLGPRYRVVEAENGAMGLAKVREVLPDLVISDVMMPVMDGDALCQAIKEDADLDFIPVILLTARASIEGRLKGLKGGADDYLSKPFDTRELLARVGNLIESRRRLKARWESGGTGLSATMVQVTSVEQAFLDEVRVSIEENMSDESFTVVRLAEAVGQSRKNLHRRLKALLDQTPSELVQDLRLARAAMMLRQRAGLVSEIAYGVGFNSVSYFSKCFRQKYGQTPTAFLAALAD